jgi:hypothetical protein
VATQQLNVIRGDYLCAQTVNLLSSVDDFTGLTCTGHIRSHPDGNLLYQFVPTVVSGVSGAATVNFDIPASITKSFPPINLYGDIEFYANDIKDSTLFQFRLNVSPDTTHI